MTVMSVIRLISEVTRVFASLLFTNTLFVAHRDTDDSKTPIFTNTCIDLHFISSSFAEDLRIGVNISYTPGFRDIM